MRSKRLDDTIEEIYNTLLNELTHKRDVENLILGNCVLTADMMNTPQKPEEFTRTYVIDKLLIHLGFPSEDWKAETRIHDGTNRSYPDYSLKVGNTYILVEAEPLNANLKDRSKGIGQVKNWIISKASNTDYGIATNGFEWVLVKFDNDTKRIKKLREFNIRALFYSFCDQTPIGDIETIKSDFEDLLSIDNILNTFSESLDALEIEREKISSKFYSDYLTYVFGINSRNGQVTRGYNLLSALSAPPSASEADKRLFCINFLNRLLFIKFLEEKGVIERGFLGTLWKKYGGIQESVPTSCYKTYLEPLFFQVLNTSPLKRRRDLIEEFKDIPYLNGGLFRPVVYQEKEYDIEDDIIEEIIVNLIEGYEWGISEDNILNPDILGNIFEKTINYLTGTGTDRQKALGAYYTPDDVTSFITRSTVNAYAMKRILDALRENGWSEHDLRFFKEHDLAYFLSHLPRANEDVQAAYDAIETITILDPGCGSGHFLITVLDELTFILNALTEALSKDVSLFEIKKHIISNNIFGADIEPTASEITKLRMWLSLIEAADFSEESHIEVLPNIEYNILTGNSLVGWINERMKQKMLYAPNENPHYASTVEATLAGLRMAYSEDEEVLPIIDTVEDAFSRTDLHDILNAYTKIIDIYNNESQGKAEQLKKLIEIVRRIMYDFTSDNYFRHLKDLKVVAGKRRKEKPIYPQVRSIPNPIHWGIDFYDILNEGGFDVILGNPPYVEVSKKKRNDELVQHYDTASCGNTYAFFFERSMLLLKPGGFCGYIVPISSVSTDRMAPLQDLLISNSQTLWVSNYDDRPGKIFSGLEDCRSSIIIGEKATTDSQCTIYSTTYQRWYSKNRDSLFDNIKYADVTNYVSPGRIPKIGENIETTILSKISTDNELYRFLSDEPSPNEDNIIYYHNAPRYWIRAMDFLPYFENERDGVIKSHQLCEIYSNDIVYKNPIIALLNSSLYYWYFILMSDGRHLNRPEIDSFPYSVDAFSEDLLEEFDRIVTELMEDFKKNAIRKHTQYQTTGRVVYDEFRPGKSKHIIDKIDDLLAQHYGFTDEEVDYIKNYNIEFRLGENMRAHYR